MNESAPYPPEIYAIEGQIRPVERELYYRVARDSYRGLGEIVEIGALFGASTTCFAAGLRDNPKVANKAGRIHVYDRFEIFPAIQRFFKSGRVGADFSGTFVKNVLPYKDMLVVQKGDARNIVWSGQPIEILFIDCCVSAEFHQGLMRTLYPYLIPGVSFVIDQDFFYQLAWWLPAKNQLFKDQLLPLEQADCTVMSKYVAPLPPALLQVDMAGLPLRSQLDLLDAQSQYYRSKGAGEIIEAHKVHLMLSSGDTEGGVSLAKTVLARSRTDSAGVRVLESLEQFGLSGAATE